MKTLSIVSRSVLAFALATAGGAAFAAEGQADAPAATAAPDSGNDAIIVTGTRATGVTVAESAAPIKLVGSDAISHVGQPNLNQVLTQLVPSFTAQSYGQDTANLTLSASLRGLNPNETLVLVNGKRRHGTSNLAILASAFQGSAAPDLDFITPASIDHIEVLEDGAAAQYGSDAIAGVINIILKKKAGGDFQATGGQYYAGDGKTYSTSLNYGYVGEHAFLNVTGFYRFHNFSQRGDYDVRVYDPTTGTVPASTIAASPAYAAALEAMPGYPNVNRIVGDSRSKFGVASYNGGVDITDNVQFYSFGSYGFRRAESYENVRLPNKVLSTNNVDPKTGLYLPPEAADGSSLQGTTAGYQQVLDMGDPSLIAAPEGFEPQEAIREQDYQFVGGLKGDLGDFHWDLSTSYGADHENVYTLNSLNQSLFSDYHNTQSNFYDGFFRAAEWTSNLDLTYKLGTFGTLAAGAEYRHNSYTIGAGEPASYYGTSAQSFAGFNPLDAGRHARHDYALYGDAALTPIDHLKIDGAVRYEDYSDFGSKTTWKATGRYDFTDAIAVRGTASTGFRAPTLAEEWYTSVNVSPFSATDQLAANSAAAKVVGIQNLKPEKSTSYSAGVVLRPLPRLTLTVDAYQIRIKDRIIGSGQVSADLSNPDDPIANAIKTAGITLESGVPAFISAFVNGPTTRTRGIDVVASYDADLETMGKATFTLSGAYNKTKITRLGQDPAIIAATGETLFTPETYAYLTSTIPHFKVIGGVNWSIGDFNIVARETYYSKSVARPYNEDTLYDYSKVGAAGITDLEVDYHLTPTITLALGSNNLFNKKPPKVKLDSEGDYTGGTAVVGSPMQFGPYGINGGYYYGRVEVKF